MFLGRRKKRPRRRDRGENDDVVVIEMIIICDRGGYKKENKNINNDNEKGIYGVKKTKHKKINISIQ